MFSHHRHKEQFSTRQNTSHIEKQSERPSHTLRPVPKVYCKSIGLHSPQGCGCKREPRRRDRKIRMKKPPEDNLKLRVMKAEWVYDNVTWVTADLLPHQLLGYSKGLLFNEQGKTFGELNISELRKT